MIIYQPYTEILNNSKVRLCCNFETRGEKHILWYEIDIKWKDYLVTEQCDAFVIGLLLLALKNEEDIEVNSSVSRRLFYGLENFVLPGVLASNSNFSKINVSIKQLSTKNLGSLSYNSTGMSCGIDSFSTYLNNRSTNSNLDIDVFTFFNVGSNGDNGGNRARDLFKERVKGVKKFTNKVQKELITIDSNLSEILQLNFASTATIRNVSAVLVFQKLITNYYYASGVKFDSFMISEEFMGFYDLLILHGLNTETTNFYSSVTHLTREERIEIVAENYFETSPYLDVCVNPSASNPKTNCSKCYKCLMTQITLEQVGLLPKFDLVFDFDIYKINKDAFIGKILALKGKKKGYENFYQYLRNKNFRFTNKHIKFKYFFKLNMFKKNVKNLIKN